ALLVPRIWFSLLHLGPWPAATFFAGGILALLGLMYIAFDLPSIGHSGGTQGQFLFQCLLPISLGGVLLARYWYSFSDSRPSFVACLVGGVLVNLGAVLPGLAAALRVRRARAAGDSRASQGAKPSSIILPASVGAAISGALVGAAIWLLTSRAFP